MNESWWWLVIIAAIAGCLVGLPIGYLIRKKDESIRFEEYRQAQIRIKQAQLSRAGRSLPAVEGAGPPIIVRRATFRRARVPRI